MIKCKIKCPYYQDKICCYECKKEYTKRCQVKDNDGCIHVK